FRASNFGFLQTGRALNFTHTPPISPQVAARYRPILHPDSAPSTIADACQLSPSDPAPGRSSEPPFCPESTCPVGTHAAASPPHCETRRSSAQHHLDPCAHWPAPPCTLQSFVPPRHIPACSRRPALSSDRSLPPAPRTK